MTLMVATRAVAADPLTHTVQKGETLYAIARRYDIAVEMLMKVNAITDPTRLAVGMTLTIPGQSAVPAATTAATTTAATSSAASSAPTAGGGTVEYVVKKGDTLYGIAKAHNVSVESILKASSIATTTIKLGQKLKIPTTTAVVAAATGTADQASPPQAGSGGVTVAVVPRPAAGAVVSSTRLWPAKGQIAYLQGKLKGVSIAAEPAVAIQAIRSGTVISAGPFRGFGQVAFVQASDGLVYVYGGASVLSVRVGDVIRTGASIGTVATEPNPSVYFFVFKGADTVDPDTVPRER